MSSKTKTTATKEDGKHALVPKLRFPEFRDAAGWDADDLGEVADFVNEKIPLERIQLASYVSTGNILADYGGVTRASKLPTTGSVTRYKPNDTLVSNIRPYLKKVWVADNEGGASNDVIVIRAKQELLPQYFSWLLKNDAFINYVMTGAKGVKMPRGDIGSMKEYPALYPSKPEQQQIAECLSSVDELMAAQARKVDELKTHKKGLMQQLFPREGETQPHLRFPEFQNAGEWVTEALGQLACYENGKAYEQDITENGKYVVVNSRFISTDGAVRKYTNADYLIAKTGEVLMVLSDLPKGKALAKCYFVEADARYAVNQRVCRLKPSRIDGKFLYYILNRHARLLAYDDGLNQTHLSKGGVTECPLCVPVDKAEQQRIASCLSSLDALITAETQKLEALKTHKKGLMQQLFPSPETNEG